MAQTRIIHADCREAIKALADCSIDACVTDPPYALVSVGKRFGADNAAPARDGVYARASAGFMGQKWDTGQVAHDPAFWREVYRVLKPGAHVVAFAGTRTYHRLACAIEDASFEIRDMVAWLYGSGFPKSHNQKGQWQGWGTALKPAFEPIVLARKPLTSTVAANVLEHGTGALNIDGCRIETDTVLSRHNGARVNAQTYNEGAWQEGTFGTGDAAGGRWPANVVHDGSNEVVGAFPESDGAAGAVTGREPSTNDRHILSGLRGDHAPRQPRGDSGSAARFFYTAKADALERLGSKHPTVKPVDLMRWLCRLVTPPTGLILDPFAGTGTTGLAAMAEGFECILIERESSYVADIERRLAWARGEGRLTAQEMIRKTEDHTDLELFRSVLDVTQNQSAE